MDDVRGKFDEARKEAAGEDLETLRHNYFIQAKMQGSDDASIGGLNVNQSGRKHDGISAKEKSKQSINDYLNFIASLEQKYGLDFAENWAADLLDEKTYKAIMKIEDQDERREAIAEAIIEGIEEGSIDPRKIEENPDLAEWLRTQSQQLDAHSMEAQNDQLSAHNEEHNPNLEVGLDSVFGS